MIIISEYSYLISIIELDSSACVPRVVVYYMLGECMLDDCVRTT